MRQIVYYDLFISNTHYSTLTTKITLKQIAAIRELARTQSFTQAAARLHTTQSNLSLSIQEIENVLGARLFHRSTKQCQLTAIGAEFLPVIERVLDELQWSVEKIQASAQLEKGVLSVGTSALLTHGLVAGLLSQYRQAYPNIDIRLEDQVTSDHVSLLRNGHVEVVIGMYSKLDADLTQYPLFDVPLVAFAHQSLGLPAQLSWQELAQFKLISIRTSSSVGRLIEKVWWQVHQRAYTPDIECHHWGSVLSVTEALQSICIAPLHALQAGTCPQLQRIDLREPAVIRTISLAHVHNRELSPAGSAFVKMCLSAYSGTTPTR